MENINEASEAFIYLTYRAAIVPDKNITGYKLLVDGKDVTNNFQLSDTRTCTIMLYKGSEESNSYTITFDKWGDITHYSEDVIN